MTFILFSSSWVAIFLYSMSMIVYKCKQKESQSDLKKENLFGLFSSGVFFKLLRLRFWKVLLFWSNIGPAPSFSRHVIWWVWWVDLIWSPCFHFGNNPWINPELFPFFSLQFCSSFWIFSKTREQHSCYTFRNFFEVHDIIDFEFLYFSWLHLRQQFYYRSSGFSPSQLSDFLWLCDFMFS